MAYNAFSGSVPEMIPAPPQAGLLTTRAEAISRPSMQSSATLGVTRQRSGATSDESVDATSALFRFLILLVIISGLTCLYVWQANAISAIKGNTQIMMDRAEALDRHNVNLMLEYSRWDAPGYIETESSRAGMVTGQTPMRLQLPVWSQPNQDTNGDTDRIRQLATLLSSSLTSGFQPR